MQVFLVIALGIALVAVMFALQNIVPVTVAFLTWTFEGSLALVLFVALIVGALVSLLASVPAIMKGRWTAASLRKRTAALEAELSDAKVRLETAQAKTSPASSGSVPSQPAPPV